MRAFVSALRESNRRKSKLIESRKRKRHNTICREDFRYSIVHRNLFYEPLFMGLYKLSRGLSLQHFAVDIVQAIIERNLSITIFHGPISSFFTHLDTHLLIKLCVAM